MHIVLDHRSPSSRQCAAAALVSFGLALAVMLQTGLFRGSTGATFDEPLYLDLGINAWREGRFAQTDLPAPPRLPLLLASWLPALLAAPGPLDPDGIIRLLPLARLAYAAVVGIPLAVLVAWWLARRRGWLAGALGGALMVFSPTILAHSSVATTDACFVLFALIALLVFRWHLAKPALGRLVLAGVAMGFALAAKQSAVFLFPAALVALALNARTSLSLAAVCRSACSCSGQCIFLIVTAIFVSDACYGFAMEPLLKPAQEHAYFAALFGDTPSSTAAARLAENIYVPVSLRSLLSQFGHGMDGHPAFLWGVRSTHGWWYYFPVVFIIKSTFAEIALAVLVLRVLLVRRSWCDTTVRLWLVALVTFLGLAMASTLNIGQRYILLVYPLVILLAVDWLAAVLAQRPRLLLGSAGALVVVQLACVSSIAPHYLGYFNVLAGGPADGYHCLVDSNLDWGQDLPSLATELQRRGSRQALLAYFGTDSPVARGIHCTDWCLVAASDLGNYDCVAISATCLQGVYLRDDPFASFRALRPSARAGYSILIYDLKEHEVRVAMAAALDTLKDLPSLAQRP
jgi:hypothetical protein